MTTGHHITQLLAEQEQDGELRHQVVQGDRFS